MALSTWAADLKESVVLVEAEYQWMDDFLEEYALTLSRYNYRAASRVFMAYQTGVTGSGVVVQNGEHLSVITNKHVVGECPYVTIKVSNKHDWRTYKHCRVVSLSSLTDLALVELPDTAALSPLPFAKTPLADADEIYAVGFPGLGGEPSWQVTKGIVSNSAVYRDELLGKHQAAIQHTAPVDPGSSGGPLLVRQADDTYSVVGINTWKAGGREGVGLSIPIESVRRFLSPDTVVDKRTDAERTRDWNDQLREDLVQAAHDLSIDYLMTRSVEEWMEIMNTMGLDYREMIDESEHTRASDFVRFVFAVEMCRYAMAGGEKAQFELTWEDVQGRRMITEVVYPEIDKKALRQATMRIR